MTNTITVADGIVPEGWEGKEFRKVRNDDEAWLSSVTGTLITRSTPDSMPSGPRLILRRKYDIEATKALLRTVYKEGTSFAINSQGTPFSFHGKAMRGTTGWVPETGGTFAHALHLSIEWPPGPWEDSLFTI